MDDSLYLSGQLLVAMPGLEDTFERAVIYMCAHSENGALGLVVNRLVEHINFPDLLAQLDIEPRVRTQEFHVHFGGPVESSRGFVLHTADYVRDSTMVVNDGFALTASVNVLKAIAEGTGPRHSLLALGYAGWGPGQLESELHANAWLTVPADDELVFGGELDAKWARAVGKLGIEPAVLSSEAGHA